MRYAFLPVAALLVAMLHPPAALAQESSNASPTAEDIIRDLRPSADAQTGPTRGIRPAARKPDAPGKAATPPAADDSPSTRLVVDFRTGSADLTPAAEHTLDSLGHALTSEALAKYRFRVEGHTDTVGTPELNKQLSTKRAEAVTAYLEKHFAIDSARLEPEGTGSDNLLVPTPDQTPEPRNRVVRVVNLGG
jgi:outer membrane protein OmpA-like peptidoglycan-associated protein